MVALGCGLVKLRSFPGDCQRVHLQFSLNGVDLLARTLGEESSQRQSELVIAYVRGRSLAIGGDCSAKKFAVMKFIATR
jgi:hypothetical protein